MSLPYPRRINNKQCSSLSLYRNTETVSYILGGEYRPLTNKRTSEHLLHKFQESPLLLPCPQVNPGYATTHLLLSQCIRDTTRHTIKPGTRFLV